MKIKLTLLSFAILFICGKGIFAQQNFHSYSAETITGDTISLSSFYGKKVMVVNTASYCGYTPQFAQLEQLYLQYHLSNNFEIIGFPCNNFGNQDPNSDSLINQFCTSNYNVTFQMMSRIDIVQGDTAPVYKWLQRADLNGVANASVAWNFNKFLIDEQGNWVNHYLSPTLPNDAAIVDWILSPSPVLTKTFQESFSDVQVRFFQNKLAIMGNLEGPLNVTIYDLAGKLIKQYNLSNAQLNSINVNELSNGFYLVKVQARSFETTKKVLLAN